MAVTGTGTQADPYIVHGFEEWQSVNVAENGGKFCKWDVSVGTVVDMNNYYPQGDEEFKIYISTDFNEVIIKNFVSHGENFISFASKQATKIEKVTFTDCFGDGCKYIIGNSVDGLLSVTFDTENISVSYTDKSIKTGNHIYGFKATAYNKINAKSVALRYTGFRKFVFGVSGDAVNIHYSTFEINGLTTFSTGESTYSFTGASIYNSFIVINSYQNVDFSKNGTIHNNVFIHNCGGNTDSNHYTFWLPYDECNILLLSQGEYYGNKGNFTIVTSDKNKLKDAEYLASKGFPISTIPG